jgi:hypothetical protein
LIRCSGGKTLARFRKRFINTKERKGIEMKLQFVVVALCAVFMAGQTNAAEKIQLKTEKDKLSYTKGWYLGNNFKKQKVDVDQKIFLQGIQDSLSGAETLMTVQEMVTFEENFQKQRAAKREEEKKKLSERIKRGEPSLLKMQKRKA